MEIEDDIATRCAFWKDKNLVYDDVDWCAPEFENDEYCREWFLKMYHIHETYLQPVEEDRLTWATIKDPSIRDTILYIHKYFNLNFYHARYGNNTYIN